MNEQIFTSFLSSWELDLAKEQELQAILRVHQKFINEKRRRFMEKYLYDLNLAAEYRLSLAQLKTINTLNGKYSYLPWVDIHHGKDFTGVFE